MIESQRKFLIEIIVGIQMSHSHGFFCLGFQKKKVASPFPEPSRVPRSRQRRQSRSFVSSRGAKKIGVLVDLLGAERIFGA